MEDTVMVVPGVVEGYDYFAVFDGHGGPKVANMCRDRMHKVVEKRRREDGCCKGLTYWEDVMRACFMNMDKESIGDGGGCLVEEQDEETGSTATVVMVGEEEVVVANCGDSRVVFCRDGLVVPLSRDHKPDRPDERERVEAAGGQVINWNGNRIQGVLATSRSIGDHYLRPYVIPEPEVTVLERTESDEFLVIATDGLWDVVSNEGACEVVRKFFGGQIQRRFPDEFSTSCAADAAAMLAELALARGSKDNISVIVVQLNMPKSN